MPMSSCIHSTKSGVLGTEKEVHLSLIEKALVFSHLGGLPTPRLMRRLRPALHLHPYTLLTLQLLQVPEFKKVLHVKTFPGMKLGQKARTLEY